MTLHDLRSTKIINIRDKVAAGICLVTEWTRERLDHPKLGYNAMDWNVAIAKI